MKNSGRDKDLLSRMVPGRDFSRNRCCRPGGAGRAGHRSTAGRLNAPSTFRAAGLAAVPPPPLISLGVRAMGNHARGCLVPGSGLAGRRGRAAHSQPEGEPSPSPPRAGPWPQALHVGCREPRRALPRLHRPPSPSPGRRRCGCAAVGSAASRDGEGAVVRAREVEAGLCPAIGAQAPVGRRWPLRRASRSRPGSLMRRCRPCRREPHMRPLLTASGSRGRRG